MDISEKGIRPNDEIYVTIFNHSLLRSWSESQNPTQYSLFECMTGSKILSYICLLLRHFTRTAFRIGVKGSIVANIVGLAFETVDAIVFHVEGRRDLLSLALTCRTLADIA